MLVAVALMAMATGARSQNLTPYLQAEVNAIASHTAQMNCLQQQGDELGAALIASFIPVHRAMADQLSAVIRQQGGNPALVTVNATPFLGTRQQIIDNSLQAHARAVDSYRELGLNTTDQAIRHLAAMGQGGSWRHYNSLVVARAATLGTPEAIYSGLLASHALEQSAIADLQTQAAQLTALGDQATANVLLGMVPSHQQQAANLLATINTFSTGVQFNIANRERITTLPPVPAHASRAMILAHFRVMDTQFVNTYAIAINALPPSPLQRVMVDGQAIALTALAALQRLPIVA
jgi:hypothetical protein